MKINTKIIIPVIIFILFVLIYEYFVGQWEQTEDTPVIRVDVIVIYPLLLALSFFIRFIVNSFIRKYKNKDTVE